MADHHADGTAFHDVIHAAVGRGMIVEGGAVHAAGFLGIILEADHHPIKIGARRGIGAAGFRRNQIHNVFALRNASLAQLQHPFDAVIQRSLCPRLLRALRRGERFARLIRRRAADRADHLACRGIDYVHGLAQTFYQSAIIILLVHSILIPFCAIPARASGCGSPSAPPRR